MDIKKEIRETGGYLLGCFILGCLCAAIGLPAWLAGLISIAVGIFFLFAKAHQDKQQQERENALAMAMHKQEVELRIAAEHQQPTAPPVEAAPAAPLPTAP